MNSNQPKNSPAVWNKLWKEHVDENYGLSLIAQEKNGIRFARIKKIIIKNFGKLRDLQVIEIGAGTGANAALLAQLGAKVTVLDYSPEALAKAKTLFNQLDIPAKFIQADALKLPTSLLGKFDIAMSFGLAEHFTGQKRVQMIKSHFDVLKPNGLAIISVPNSWNIPYRIFKFLAQMTPYWKVGEEYPFSRPELSAICQELGVTNYFFVGDSFISSLNFINPLWILSRVSGHKPTKVNSRQEASTFLDQYISYALVLIAQKPV